MQQHAIELVHLCRLCFRPKISKQTGSFKLWTLWACLHSTTNSCFYTARIILLSMTCLLYFTMTVLGSCLHLYWSVERARITVSTLDETNTLKGTSLNAACNAVRGETLMIDWQPLCEAFSVNGELFAIQCTRRLSLTLILRECLSLKRYWQSSHVCDSAQQHGESWRQSLTWFMKTRVKWDLLTD